MMTQKSVATADKPVQDEVVDILRHLVQTDSVNPSLVPGAAGEGKIAGYIADTMRSAGLEVRVDEVAPGRPNVVSVLEGHSPGRSLMFCGHIDTVTVAGMKTPFDPVICDNRLYGRGSQDMKGGVAAMMGTALHLAKNGGLAAGKLIVAAVADEEYASLGAEALVKRWHADAAVVPEPTDLTIAFGHKGFAWIEVAAEGRAAHGSRPQDGRDAIFRMARILSRLEQLDRELQRRPAYAVQGTGSLHASLISGGRELSSYPDRCVMQFERRTTSAEPQGTALEEVQKIIDELTKEDPEFAASATLLFDRAPFETPTNHPIIEFLERAVQTTGRTPQRGGVSFWTDAAVLASASIPTVVFGPGGEGLHSVEEYVRISEVVACRDALVDLARQFC